MINWQEIKSEYESTSCTMKALAEKFNISPSTLRSRKKRENWQRKATENVATQNDIVATDKKGGQLNNKNAKNNAGGSAPKKNKNAVKTGEHETIYSDFLIDEEKSLFEKQVDSSLVLSQEIHLLRVRQLRMLKRLEQAENGLNDNEKSILYELRGRKTLIEAKGKKDSC